jgi:hypothetical protein
VSAENPFRFPGDPNVRFGREKKVSDRPEKGMCRRRASSGVQAWLTNGSTGHVLSKPIRERQRQREAQKNVSHLKVGRHADPSAALIPSECEGARQSAEHDCDFIAKYFSNEETDTRYEKNGSPVLQRDEQWTTEYLHVIP